MSTQTALTTITLDGASVEQPRPAHLPLPEAPPGEEALVIDARAGLSPAEVVERKLASLLKGGPLPVSHLLRSTCRGRRPG